MKETDLSADKLLEEYWKRVKLRETVQEEKKKKVSKKKKTMEKPKRDVSAEARGFAEEKPRSWWAREGRLWAERLEEAEGRNRRKKKKQSEG